MVLGKYKKQEVAFDRDRSMNCHILLLGESGCGKSTMAQKMMLKIVEEGGTVVTLDIHHVLDDSQILEKYRTYFRTFINTIDVYKDGIPCKILQPMQYVDGTYEKQIDVVGALTDVFGRAFNLGAIQRATLRTALSNVSRSGEYDKQGISAIGKALASIDKDVAKIVMEKIYMITNHNIFISVDWPVKEGKINIFRLSKFNLETQKAVAEMLLSYIWRRAMVSGCTGDGIYLFIDECQNLPCGKNSLLGEILSEGRKFNVNLLLATQQLMQGHPSVVQQRMAQCGLCLYFRPGAGQTRTVAKMIDPNGIREWSSVLHSLSIGEFIAVGALKIDGYSIDHPLKITSFEEQSDMKKKESPKRNTCRVRRNVFAEVEGFGF